MENEDENIDLVYFKIIIKIISKVISEKKEENTIDGQKNKDF